MPRTGHVVLLNYPHHVVQRGHNRQVVFAATEDYQRYLTDLCELKDIFGVKVYAYCLMTNHVHLLLAPGEAVAGLGQLMKALAARVTRYRNRLEGRSGTLWESRYKSSVVQSDAYLLACCRYIELNPVRARMVADAADYPWSSYKARVDDVSDSYWLDAAPCFAALGNTPMERRHQYEAFMHQAIPIDEIKLIRDALQRGQLTGTSRFVDEVERVVGLRIELRGQGRPRADSENKSVPFFVFLHLGAGTHHGSELLWGCGSSASNDPQAMGRWGLWRAYEVQVIRGPTIDAPGNGIQNRAICSRQRLLLLALWLCPSAGWWNGLTPGMKKPDG